MKGNAVNHAKLAAAGVPHLGDPGIVLRGDQDLVRACLAQGGFPRAVQFRGGAVWVGPDGAPWAGFAKAKTGKRVRARP